MSFKSICLAVTLAAISVPSFAAADIWRGCQGTLTYSDIQGSTVLAHIEGRGPCRNKANANTCRANARNVIAACVNALWRDRWDHTVPYECKFNSSGRSKAELTWNGIFLPNHNSVKGRMEYAACCTGAPADASILGKLTLRVSGDKQCGFNGTVSNSYKSVCSAVREAGLCG